MHYALHAEISRGAVGRPVRVQRAPRSPHRPGSTAEAVGGGRPPTAHHSHRGPPGQWRGAPARGRVSDQGAREHAQRRARADGSGAHLEVALELLDVEEHACPRRRRRLPRVRSPPSAHPRPAPASTQPHAPVSTDASAGLHPSDPRLAGPAPVPPAAPRPSPTPSPTPALFFFVNKMAPIFQTRESGRLLTECKS